MLKNLRLRYNKFMDKNKWTTIDQRRTRIMIKDIDKQLLHRRIMRSLEKFVGGRDYGTDYRLLQRTGSNFKSQNRRDLPRDISLDRIEVLRNDTKGVKVRKGIMQTKTEPTLEQTQQSVSDEVLLSTEGLLSGIEDSHHGPSDAKHNPPYPLKVSQKSLVSFLTEIKHISIDFLTTDSILQAGNPVNEILLKLNLLDHRLVLTDPKIHIKMDMELKIFKKDGQSSFQDKERYEHVGLKVTSSQEGKRLQDDDKRLNLVDDFKEAQDHIQVKLKEQVQV
ncbi:hypothetical protein Tco_1326848 [Tanacetum coccineum]